MGKLAFLFSGQGSQYIGMGKEIADHYTSSYDIFSLADKALGFSISHLCFEGEENELGQTENTQPAILATSIAILEALKEYDIKPDVVAGLSLGEYSALVCSGAMDFEEAVKLVKKRGKFMQEAVPQGVGTMAAILGLDRDKIEKLCEEVSTTGIVEPANYNCKGQVVIAGEVGAVKMACTRALEIGAKRAILLNVSGPFHTSMLEPAAINLENELGKLSMTSPKIPYVTNVTGKYVQDMRPENIRHLLKKQVMSPVYWEDSIKSMIDDGVDTFIEIGPGKALSSFVKKVDRKKKIYNVEDMKSLAKVLKEIKGMDLC